MSSLRSGDLEALQRVKHSTSAPRGGDVHSTSSFFGDIRPALKARKDRAVARRRVLRQVETTKLHHLVTARTLAMILEDRHPELGPWTVTWVRRNRGPRR